MHASAPDVRKIRELNSGDMFQFMSLESIADQRTTFLPSLEAVYIVSSQSMGRQDYMYDPRERPWMSTSRKCCITWLYRRTGAETPVPRQKDMESHYSPYTGRHPDEPNFINYYTGRDTLESQRRGAPEFEDTEVRYIGHCDAA